MIIAGGISMKYLQTMALAGENIYVVVCAINVDFKTSYVTSAAI